MLFSIITVTYNAAEVLPPTLKSVAEQSFRDFEYLIIDGASSDDTLQLVGKAAIAGTAFFTACGYARPISPSSHRAFARIFSES